MKKLMCVCLVAFTVLSIGGGLAQALDRPNNVPVRTVNVDADLSDWTGAEWIPLDQNYSGVATDVTEAYQAIAWDPATNRIYVAVKVLDTAHKFLNSYTAWDGRDAVEIYIHTSNTGSSAFYALQDTAQCYAIGVTLDNPAVAWIAFGNGVAVPAGANAVYAGKDNGDGWLYYEIAMVPYNFYGGLHADPKPADVVDTLYTSMTVGIDAVVVAHNGTSFTGMKAENGFSGKYNNYTKFGLHTLTGGPTVTPTPTPGPTSTPTPTPTLPAPYWDGLRNGDFEADTVPPPESSDANIVPMYWSSTRPIACWVGDGSLTWELTKTFEVWDEAPGLCTTWQTVGTMTEGKTYCVSFKYGAWVPASNFGNVKLYSGNSMVDVGTDLLSTSETLNCPVAQIWNPEVYFWYTCDAAHAGKVLSLAIEVTQNSGLGIDPAFDNVTLTQALEPPTPTPTQTPTPTETPTPTPTDGPTPTPCPWVGLQNGDFEFDDVGGLGSSLQIVPQAWSASPADGVSVDYSQSWCGSNNADLWKPSYTGRISLWQNLGGMEEGKIYLVSCMYAGWNTGCQGNVRLYAGYACAEKGTELVCTSDGFSTGTTQTWYPMSFWYVCDAAHAGKSLSISIDFDATENKALAVDNVTVTGYFGDTPTPTPLPPWVGLRNGDFEADTVPPPENGDANAVPMYWSSTRPIACWIGDGSLTWELTKTFEVWDNAPGLCTTWQNVGPMTEGTTYYVTFKYGVWEAARDFGNVKLYAANNMVDLGTDLLATSETLNCPVRRIWYPEVNFAYTCDAAHAGKILSLAIEVMQDGPLGVDPAFDNVTLTQMIATPTPTPFPWVGLQNGDFEADTVLPDPGYLTGFAPMYWSCTRPIACWIEYGIGSWRGTQVFGVWDEAPGLCTTWQNVGSMTEGTTYYVTFKYGAWAPASNFGNVKLYAADNMVDVGTDLLSTSETLSCPVTQMWYPEVNFWYTCDAAHAGKVLSLAIEVMQDSALGVNPLFDNVTLTQATGPTPTPNPTPTPTLPPAYWVGLQNGDFEADTVLPDPGYLTGFAPMYWSCTRPIACWIEYGIGSWRGTQVYSLWDVAPGLSTTWQNVGTMTEGTTYNVTFRYGAWSPSSNFGSVKLYSGNSMVDVGTDLLCTSETLSCPVTQIWYPEVNLTYTCDAAHAGKVLSLAIEVMQDSALSLNPVFDNVTLVAPGLLTVPVVVSDFAPADMDVPVVAKVKVQDADTGAEISVQNVALQGEINGDGNYAANLPVGNLAAGHYNVLIKTYNHVQKLVDVVKTNDALVTDAVELAGGDLHGDNEVFFTSLSVVLKWFGTGGDYYPMASGNTSDGPAVLAHAKVFLADYDPLDYNVHVGFRILLYDDAENIVYKGTQIKAGSLQQLTPSESNWAADISISPVVTPGTYNLAIKSYGHNAKVVSCAIDGATITELGNILLPAGDCHGDNEVFFTPLSIVLKYFGTSGDADPFE